jgi:hypothetical protein
MADEAPLLQTRNHQVVAVGTAGNDATTVLFQAPFACTVTGVNFIPAAAITGANTNTRLVELVNKGQAGSSTTQIATVQFNSGVNATAFDEKAITLSGTAANLVLASGDTIIWNSTHVGTGITDPGGLVSVTLSRNDG